MADAITASGSSGSIRRPADRWPRCAVSTSASEVGEVAAVVGPSGSGKSTLLRLVAGLDRPSAGRLVVFGRDLTMAIGRASSTTTAANRVGVVEQHYRRALSPYLTVARAIGLPLALRGDGPGRAGRPASATLLERIGLPGRGEALPPPAVGRGAAARRLRRRAGRPPGPAPGRRAHRRAGRRHRRDDPGRPARPRPGGGDDLPHRHPRRARRAGRGPGHPRRRRAGRRRAGRPAGTDAASASATARAGWPRPCPSPRHPVGARGPRRSRARRSCSRPPPATTATAGGRVAGPAARRARRSGAARSTRSRARRAVARPRSCASITGLDRPTERPGRDPGHGPREPRSRRPRHVPRPGTSASSTSCATSCRSCRPARTWSSALSIRGLRRPRQPGSRRRGRSSGSAWPSTPSARRTSCRPASGCGSPWPGRWSPSPSSSSSTSRPRRSTDPGRAAVARLLAELEPGRVTILATTHDPALIDAASDRLDLAQPGGVTDHRARPSEAGRRGRRPSAVERLARHPPHGPRQDGQARGRRSTGPGRS